MFRLISRLATTVTDYTVGTAIVLVQLALVGPREDQRAFRLLDAANARTAN